MSGTVKRVAKNTGFLYFRVVVSLFISLWTTRIILNSLGASDFGLYTIVGGAIGMLGFLNASMSTSTQRFMNYYQTAGGIEKQKEIFNVSMILHFFISWIIVFLLVLAGFLFFNGILSIPQERIDAAVIIYACLVISTLFHIISVPYEAALNAHEDMLFFAIVGIVESVLKLTIAFMILYSSIDKLILYGTLMSFIPIITMLMMSFHCRKQYQECVISLRRYYNKKTAYEMGRFAGWRFLSAVSAFSTQYGLGVVLNHFYGTLLNAAQGIANQVSAYLMTLCNNMLKALNPIIAKSEGAGDRDKMMKVTLLGSKYSFLLLSIFAIPCMLEMPYLLKLWLGNVPKWCVLFCQLQLLRSVLEQMTITLGTAVNAHGKVKGISIVRSILDVMPFVATFFLFKMGYPPYFMYIVWILFYSIFGGIAVLLFSIRYSIISFSSYLQIVFLPCLTVMILMLFLGGGAVFLMEPSVIRLVMTFLMSTIGMIIAFFIYASKVESDIIIGMTNKKGIIRR